MPNSCQGRSKISAAPAQKCRHVNEGETEDGVERRARHNVVSLAIQNGLTVLDRRSRLPGSRRNCRGQGAETRGR